MPQTNPFHSLVPRKLTDTELARAIRLNLESEMDAINLYSAHIDATDNEAAKAVLRHVMDEEK
ncbi:MAG TPA: ferritin, partial [Aggregicoccus sp.]|nr:ferritin [Aggregicoccus sp.]